MQFFKNTNYLLGIPGLIPEWKQLFSKKYLSNDITAGIAVAFVAIPLSLAIALASGVSPATGLITAIIAGIVCALFGGTTLAVSGPAAAMTILLADTVDKFGVEALVVVCLIAGCMQLVSGIFGLGKLGRYVPLPVIAGFTAGIGVIILIGQLPRAFGLAPPAESHIVDVFNHLRQYFHEINGTCLMLVVLTIAIIRGLPKILPRVQPVLPAVIVSTVLAYVFNLDVPLIGSIPRSLPAPHLPSMPNIPVSDLLFGAFTIYILASLETLLSSSAVDKMTQGKKHNSDQELIGQGLGNIAVSMFGGMPITGVIARSATNVRVGAKTRRASIIHSFTILLTVLFFAPLISLIPIAALAGVLFSIAFSMINYKEFLELWKTARAEAFIYAVTFFTIISVDLVAGVQAGIIVSALIVLFKAAQSRLDLSSTSSDNTTRLSLSGSLTFLSTGQMAKLELALEQGKLGNTFLLDLSNLTNMDTTGAGAIVDLSTKCTEKNISFYIKGLPRRFESLFSVVSEPDFLDKYYLISEQELRKKESPTSASSSRSQLIHGVRRFYTDRKQNDKRLFQYLERKQDPHTLFITCSDSRMVPSVMTSADPGELFIIRNVGNYIPLYQADANCSEFAALDFSLNYLDISDIVICGHANCGAIKACKDLSPNQLPSKLQNWIEKIRSQLKIDPNMKLNEIARQNVLNQINNLKQYPVVQEKLAQNAINIHGWFFDFEKSIVYEWNEQTQKFESLISDLHMLADIHH